VTLADVAARAGVSLTTASRALNGSTRTVGPDLRERVLAAADALHYVVNQHAQAVARGASQTVGVVLGDIADPYFAAVAAGVSEAAGPHGLDVTLIPVDGAAESTVDSLAVLRGSRPRAVLMTVSRPTSKRLDARIAAELAGVESYGGGVAYLGSAPGHLPGLPIRHRASSAELAARLSGLGYRKVAVLTGPRELRIPVERAAGFMAGMRAAGRPVPARWQLAGEMSRGGGFAAMSRLLESRSRPELVFATTDVMAVGAMAAIRAHGLEPGKDIAVAGYDDIEMLQDVLPGLTSVSLPLRELGRRALQLALAGADAKSPKPIRGTVTLRDSTPRRDS